MIIINSNIFSFDIFLKNNKEKIAYIGDKIVSKIFKDTNLIEKDNIDIKEGINIIDGEILIENIKIIKNFNKLVFDLIDNKNFYCHLILNIVKYYNIKIDIILLNHSDIIDNFSLNIDKIIDKNIDKGDIKITYSDNFYNLKDRDKLIEDMFLKINVLDLKNQIVLALVPSIRDAKALYKKLKSTKETYIINDDIDKTKFIKYHTKEKMIVLIMTNLIPLPYNNITKVFDSYMVSNYFENKFFYSSKDRSNLLKTYLNNNNNELDKLELTRMTTLDFFNKSPTLTIPHIPYHNLYKFYTILSNEILFNGIIKEDEIKKINKTLINLNVISKENRILVDEKLLFSIPLNFRQALIIYKILVDKILKDNNNNNIFPFIVLACIIDTIKIGDLKFYLETWNIFAKEFKTLDVKMEDLNNYLLFTIINKVKQILFLLNNKYDIEIGLFNVDNLIDISKPLLTKIYKEYVYHIKEKDKEIIYTNNQEEAKLKLFNETLYPDKIIAFNQNRNNNKGIIDEIIFYLII